MVKIEVTTHSENKVDVIELESYDEAEVDKKRNDDSLLSILIGRNSYSRIDIKNIKVIEDAEEE